MSTQFISLWKNANWSKTINSTWQPRKTCDFLSSKAPIDLTLPDALQFSTISAKRSLLIRSFPAMRCRTPALPSFSSLELHEPLGCRRQVLPASVRSGLPQTVDLAAVSSSQHWLWVARNARRYPQRYGMTLGFSQILHLQFPLLPLWAVGSCLVHGAGSTKSVAHLGHVAPCCSCSPWGHDRHTALVAVKNCPRQNAKRKVIVTERPSNSKMCQNMSKCLPLSFYLSGFECLSMFQTTH